jgi:hypothetical protein
VLIVNYKPWWPLALVNTNVWCVISKCRQ